MRNTKRKAGGDSQADQMTKFRHFKQSQREPLKSAGEQDWKYNFKEKQEPIHQNELEEQNGRPECPVGGLEVYICSG